MTVPNRPGDSRRGTVFHPPDAALYLQFSPRRRTLSALIVGAGFALAAAFVAYGVMTQKSWAFSSAIVSAFMGPVLAWFYQDRGRPAQLVEDRARAMALYDSFHGRLEFGRLALTQAGVELDGESISWPAIHRIDTTLADARLKRATLALDAAHAGRKIPLSLAGLSESPGVVYAVMKMLWMRQVTARNIAEFMPRMKPLPLRHAPATSTAGTLWMGLALIAGVAALAGTLKLLTGATPWLAALSAGAGVAICFLAGSRSDKANWREAARRQERTAELEKQRPTGEEFVVRRKPVRRWPSIITLLFSAPAVIFFAMGDRELATGFLVFAAVVSLIAWTIAWMLGAGVVATLTPTGIVLRGHEIPWRDITSLDLHYLPRIETGQLVIRLARPRKPRTLGERINSSLSAGHSDREIVVSLARSEEPPQAVWHLAQMRWERAIGSDRANAALFRQVEERVRDSRTWNQFSAREKSRSLSVGAAVFALLGFTIHGVSVDFRMSDAWFTTSFVLSAVITVWGVVALLRARVLLSLRNGQGTPSYIALFLLMSLFFGGMLWLAIGQSWADLATRGVGRDVTRDVMYDKAGRSDPKKCPYPLAIRLDAKRPYRFCARQEAYASLPSVGELRLQLRESWFGVHIVSVSIIEN